MASIHQRYRLKRAMEIQGEECIFSRQSENEFHEMQGETETIKCRGLFHEASGYMNVSIAEAGKIYAKREPKLLVIYQENIIKGNLVNIDGSKYQVTGIDDLGNLHLCLDLSLEAV